MPSTLLGGLLCPTPPPSITTWTSSTGWAMPHAANSGGPCLVWATLPQNKVSVVSCNGAMYVEGQPSRTLDCSQPPRTTSLGGRSTGPLETSTQPKSSCDRVDAWALVPNPINWPMGQQWTGQCTPLQFVLHDKQQSGSRWMVSLGFMLRSVHSILTPPSDYLIDNATCFVCTPCPKRW